MKRVLLAVTFVFVLWAASSPAVGEHTLPNDCALYPIPTTYEAPRDRRPYLLGQELAGFNMIASDDSYFGTSRVEQGARGDRSVAGTPYIPPTLLKAIGFVERKKAQGAPSVYCGPPRPA